MATTIQVSNALSKRQSAILECIRTFTADYGYAPTVREICDRCGYNSTSAVLYNIDQLEELGLLKRKREIARSIVLTEKGKAA